MFNLLIGFVSGILFMIFLNPIKRVLMRFIESISRRIDKI